LKADIGVSWLSNQKSMTILNVNEVEMIYGQEQYYAGNAMCECFMSSLVDG